MLSVLLKLQPTIARKAHYSLTAASEETVQEASQSRFPALSRYQLLIVYNQVAHQQSASKATSSTHSLDADRDRKIVDWLSDSWNHIAQLEAECTENIPDQLLDQVVQKHLSTLPPATFNAHWRQIFEGLTDSPQPPAAETSGKLTLHQDDTIGENSALCQGLARWQPQPDQDACATVCSNPQMNLKRVSNNWPLLGHGFD